MNDLRREPCGPAQEIGRVEIASAKALWWERVWPMGMAQWPFTRGHTREAEEGTGLYAGSRLETNSSLGFHPL